MRFLLLCLLLAACAQKAPHPRQVLTREGLNTSDDPLLLAELADLETAATLAPSSRNGAVRTWASGDRVSLSLRHGVLVASRGLGHDLMSADVGNTLDMLDGQTSGYYERFHTYLDGEYQTLYRTFRCKRSGARAERIVIFDRPQDTTRIEEHCVSPGLKLTNIYWRGPDGFLWKTRQWVSPGAGYLTTERLIR
ncbi:YjbF family lipoprotein [Ruegeria sp. HKCCD8929]|uniref:YjbF family lipoprotein n=1 Tax=Ruegeria sp. HKCCD8929 TaxID=2683006 RepID=UPI0014896439